MLVADLIRSDPIVFFSHHFLPALLSPVPIRFGNLLFAVKRRLGPSLTSGSSLRYYERAGLKAAENGNRPDDLPFCLLERLTPVPIVPPAQKFETVQLSRR